MKNLSAGRHIFGPGAPHGKLLARLAASDSVFVLGAPRTGTTAVLRGLSSAANRIPFSEPFRFASKRNALGFTTLPGQMLLRRMLWDALVKSHAIVLKETLRFHVSGDLPTRLMTSGVLPHARTLLVIRNPLEVLVSVSERYGTPAQHFDPGEDFIRRIVGNLGLTLQFAHNEGIMVVPHEIFAGRPSYLHDLAVGENWISPHPVVGPRKIPGIGDQKTLFGANYNRKRVPPLNYSKRKYLWTNMSEGLRRRYPSLNYE